MKVSQKASSRHLAARLLCAASVAVLAVGSAQAQEAPATDTGAEEAAGDEIIVTGFRQSLEAALNVKRDSVAAVDAIVAEDIA